MWSTIIPRGVITTRLTQITSIGHIPSTMRRWNTASTAILTQRQLTDLILVASEDGVLSIENPTGQKESEREKKKKKKDDHTHKINEEKGAAL